MTNRLKATLQGPARTYLNRIAWVLQTAWQRDRSRILRVFALDMLGVASGAAWLGGIVLYARFLETGEQSVVMGWEITLSQAPSFVVGFASLLAVLGILSAVLIYRSHWLAADIAGDYTAWLQCRLVAAVGNPDHAGWPSLLPDRPRMSLQRMAGMTTRLTAQALRRMLRGALPIIVFVVAIVALLSVSWRFTLMLLPVAAIYLIPLYIANRAAARAHVAYIAQSSISRQAYQQVLGKAIDRVVSLDHVTDAAEAVVTSTDYRTAERLFYEKRLAEKRVKLINALFGIVCLLALFAFFVIGGEGEAQGWSGLLIYLVALRFALGSLGEVTSAGVALSRFLPEYERLSVFLDDVQRLPKQRRKLAPWKFPSQLQLEHDSIVWDAPAIVILVADERAGHCAADSARVALASRLPEHASLFADQAPPLIDARPLKNRELRRALGKQSAVVLVPSAEAALGWQHDAQLGPRIVALGVLDGATLMGLGDVHWFEQMGMELSKQRAAFEMGDDDQLIDGF